ncbi:MAG: sulfotransferase domain-containing protein [Rhodocyclaceae bacterium]|nr:sulfotransferase domain-containing protein [Rhodocyclaceae bacterium]MBK9311873.1 sulfotransferase domain-containing protein [Rhodocyclaceae bacterium]MBK9956775.1 sulfotransferase domain-containing protein [Rhodocyclaceae bacterium]
MKRSRLLYVTSSSYSGSTLLAFLLNTHPGIFTVSEMIGWDFEDGEEFRCSCGATLDRCPLFVSIAKAFADHGLPFRTNRFGTAYQLVADERLNRYLTTNLPRSRNSTAERLRDTLVRRLPLLRNRLRRTEQANRVFVETVLAYSGASVFADVSKEPHRLRHLARIPEFKVAVLYLVRDIRGVVVSNMRERANDVRTAARIWLWDQHDIQRILQEFPGARTLYYEDLCQDVDRELAGMHAFLGLDHVPYPGDFKSSEHHILGNSMRTREVSKIVSDEKWKTAISSENLGAIRQEATHFLAENPRTPARHVIERYLDAGGWPSSDSH